MSFSKKDQAFFDVSASRLASLNDAAIEKITLVFEENGMLQHSQFIAIVVHFFTNRIMDAFEKNSTAKLQPMIYTNIMFSNRLDAITPYVPGQSIESIQTRYGLTNVVKLASNENPLGPAVSLHDISTSLERYPDYNTHPFLGNLADYLNRSPDQLILGNGSDEILLLIALATISPSDEILSSTCTFSEYKFVAHVTGATYIEAPMRDYTYCIDAMIDRLTDKTKIVFIANPNNPTGTIVGHDDIERLCHAASDQTLIVLDEAYAEYVTDTNYPDSLALMKQFPNLMVTRTFSKIYGLAGLRIGYGVAHPSVIHHLQKVRPPFNVNNIALTAGDMALKQASFVSKSLAVNNEGREFLMTQLHNIDAHIPPTQGNFIYIDFKTINGIQLANDLLQSGIIVRSMASFGCPNAIRVTIGTPDQNSLFIKELFQCLKKQ